MHNISVPKDSRRSKPFLVDVFSKKQFRSWDKTRNSFCPNKAIIKNSQTLSLAILAALNFYVQEQHT